MNLNINKMDLQKAGESRILKPILEKSKLARMVYMKLYLWQRKRRHCAIVPGELVDQIGMKAVQRKCREAKWKKGDIQVGSYKIRIV